MTILPTEKRKRGNITLSEVIGEKVWPRMNFKLELVMEKTPFCTYGSLTSRSIDGYAIFLRLPTGQISEMFVTS